MSNTKYSYVKKGYPRVKFPNSTKSNYRQRMAKRRRMSTTTLYPRIMSKAGEVKTVDCGYTDPTGANALPNGSLGHCTYVTPDVFVNSATGLTGGYILINGTVSGTGYNQRIGNKITMKSIDVKLTLNATSGETNARVCLILDRQCNGASPATTDIFGDVSALDVIINPVLAGIKMINRKRFKILKEQYTITSSSHNDQTVRLFYKRSIPVDYSGATSVIGSVATNAVYLIAMGTSSAFYNYVTQMSCRVRYYDN